MSTRRWTFRIFCKRVHEHRVESELTKPTAVEFAMAFHMLVLRHGYCCYYCSNVRGAVVVLLDQTDYSGPALSDYFIACHGLQCMWFCCVVRRRTGSLASSLFPWRTSSEQRKRGRFRCLDAKGRGGTHQWLDGPPPRINAVESPESPVNAAA